MEKSSLNFFCIMDETPHRKKLIDCCIKIFLIVAELDEIRQWVLRMGPAAVVLEPDELKRSVWKSLKDTIDQYSGISDKEIDAMVFESQASFAS